jgi:hypothetical protein
MEETDKWGRSRTKLVKEASDDGYFRGVHSIGQRCSNKRVSQAGAIFMKATMRRRFPSIGGNI